MCSLALSQTTASLPCDSFHLCRRLAARHSRSLGPHRCPQSARWQRAHRHQWSGLRQCRSARQSSLSPSAKAHFLPPHSTQSNHPAASTAQTPPRAPSQRARYTPRGDHPLSLHKRLIYNELRWGGVKFVREMIMPGEWQSQPTYYFLLNTISCERCIYSIYAQPNATNAESKVATRTGPRGAGKNEVACLILSAR